MAYTGTAETVYLNICEQQLSPGVQIGPNCLANAPVKAAVFFPVDESIYIPDAQELSDLFSVIIMLVALVFIIGMIKKAIEQ